MFSDLKEKFLSKTSLPLIIQILKEFFCWIEVLNDFIFIYCHIFVGRALKCGNIWRQLKDDHFDLMGKQEST